MASPTRQPHWRIRRSAGNDHGMGRVERQLSHQGEDRKSLLLERAEALLLERGYAGTRMRDVAEAAGVTKGLLYWYFESKEALIRVLAQGSRPRLRRR